MYDNMEAVVMPLQIIIVDDHRLCRMGLKSAIKSDHPDICETGDADNGGALSKMIIRHGKGII